MIPRLGERSDLDVGIRLQHIIEDALQRFGERCRGVLHPWCEVFGPTGPQRQRDLLRASPGTPPGERDRGEYGGDQRCGQDARGDGPGHPGQPDDRAEVGERDRPCGGQRVEHSPQRGREERPA